METEFWKGMCDDEGSRNAMMAWFSLACLFEWKVSLFIWVAALHLWGIIGFLHFDSFSRTEINELVKKGGIMEQDFFRSVLGRKESWLGSLQWILFNG